MKFVGILGVIISILSALIWIFFRSTVAEIMTGVGMAMIALCAFIPEKKAPKQKRMRFYFTY